MLDYSPSENKKASTPEQIWAGLDGAMESIAVFHNHIIVAVYVRPEKTAGGIIRPQSNLDEDKWQGKVGLVVAKGPLAFVDDGRTKFNGQNIDVGDWVLFRVNDTSAISIAGMQCRMLEDIHIRGKIESPEVIY